MCCQKEETVLTSSGCQYVMIERFLKRAFWHSEFHDRLFDGCLRRIRGDFFVVFDSRHRYRERQEVHLKFG